MKIDFSRIPFEGCRLEEEASAKDLDLETEAVKFHGPVKIRADVSKITNALSVNLEIKAVRHTRCGRCLEEYDAPLHKRLSLNYSVGKQERIVDLGPDIREEIILDYPIKPLCRTDCQGLCPQCGKNLNQGKCGC